MPRPFYYFIEQKGRTFFCFIENDYHLKRCFLPFDGKMRETRASWNPLSNSEKIAEFAEKKGQNLMNWWYMLDFLAIFSAL